METGIAPVFIEAGALTRCRHRLHLDSVLPELVADLPEDTGVRQRKEAANLFRDQVRADLGGGVRIDPALDTAGRAAATLAACEAGVERIWGAVLPPEPDTGRRGHAEFLQRDPDRGGYVPVIVVNHKVTDPRSGDVAPGDPIPRTSPMDRWAPADDPSRRARSHLRDQLRLAQLYRMLQRHGFAGPALVGGVIGLGFDRILVHDLTNVLTEYDTRFADRIAIVRGELDTLPVRVPECRSCPWWARCRGQLTERRDVSMVALGARADVLRAEGVRTVDALATWTGAPPRDWQFGDFTDAVRTARAWLQSIPIMRRVESVSITRADVEVDVDLESFQEHGAYLWGTLVDGVYRPFVTWDPLPTADEARSFAEFWRWLTDLLAETLAAGKTFAAYCYSRAAEDKWLYDSARRFAGRPGVPSVEEIRAFVDGPHWVDVYQAVSDQFLSANGKGLKKIAPFAGFAWRDPEASGEASMEWYKLAVGYDGDPDLVQRRRILEYNEDDVLATRAVREWISAEAARVPYLPV